MCGNVVTSERHQSEQTLPMCGKVVTSERHQSEQTPVLVAEFSFATHKVTFFV